MRQVVLKGLKRLSVMAILLLGSWQVSGAIITDNTAAIAAYENGAYTQAAAYYASRIDPHAPDPALLYNLGNCFCRNKEFVQALVCYEKAWRLGPGDSDIIENLNFVRRKFFLPEVGQTGNPLDWLQVGRDQLRPDQWMVLAACGWLVMFAALSARRRLRRGVWIIIVPAIAAMMLSAGAAVWQYNGPYRSDAAAVVLNARPQVFILPTASADAAEFRLHNGQQVIVLEKRSGWVRIKVEGNGDGWVKEDVIVSLWGDDSILDWSRIIKK